MREGRRRKREVRELREGGGEVKGRRRGEREMSEREMGEREMGEREMGERKERGERGRGSTHSSVQLPWVINGMYMFSADGGALTNKPSVLYSPCERSLVYQPLSFCSEVQVLGEKGSKYYTSTNKCSLKHLF